jgi:hypothetical protein
VFVQKVQKTGPVELTGWVRLFGEVVLYPEAEAMQKEANAQATEFPLCVSGVFPDQEERIDSLKQFDKRKVIIKGEVVDFYSLRAERGFLPRKMIGDSVVINNCFGKNVLRIESMEFARD